MKPTEFEGSNVVFAENQPEYLPLPAYKAPTGEVVSCWELNWKERIKMLFTGRIFLTVLTFNGPLQPQLPSVENPVEECKKLDFSQIDNIQFDGIDHDDYPDFVDAYIVSADYCGEDMTEEQLERVNEDSQFVHEKLMEQLF